MITTVRNITMWLYRRCCSENNDLHWHLNFNSLKSGDRVQKRATSDIGILIPLYPSRLVENCILMHAPGAVNSLVVLQLTFSPGLPASEFGKYARLHPTLHYIFSQSLCAVNFR
jgi:hypothetical protein